MRVVIELEGGLVQDVYTDAGGQLQVLVVDHDAEESWHEENVEVINGRRAWVTVYSNDGSIPPAIKKIFESW